LGGSFALPPFRLVRGFLIVAGLALARHLA
jgi:hypothetical protein